MKALSRLTGLAAAAAALLLAACTPKEKEVAVTGVKVSPTSLSLEIGQSAMLTATVEPSDATDKGVNWTSSNLSVAAVQEGTVKAIGAGNATITNSLFTDRYICYNSTSPRFAAYKSSSRQQPIQLYRERQTETSLHWPEATAPDATHIYDLQGRRIIHQTKGGIYIQGGRKRIVR